MHFRPSFFEDKNPKFVFVWLTEERFSNLVDGYEVINEYFFYLSVDEHGDVINAGGVKTLLSKYRKNSLLILGNRCQRWQKVTVAEIALDDLRWLNVRPQEDWIGNDLRDPFPAGFVYPFYSSQAGFGGGE